MKRQLNDIYIIHISLYKNFKIFFSRGYNIFTCSLSAKDFTSIISRYEIRLGEVFTEENINKYINEVLVCSSHSTKEISLSELLNNEDKIMIETPLFKNRIKPLIRNQKINIINGN